MNRRTPSRRSLDDDIAGGADCVATILAVLACVLVIATYFLVRIFA